MQDEKPQILMAYHGTEQRGAEWGGAQGGASNLLNICIIWKIQTNDKHLGHPVNLL